MSALKTVADNGSTKKSKKCKVYVHRRASSTSTDMDSENILGVSGFKLILCILGFDNRNGFVWGLNPEPSKYAHVPEAVLITLQLQLCSKDLINDQPLLQFTAQCRVI